MIRKSTVLLSAAIILLAGCKKKEGPAGPQGVQGASGPAYKGTVAGHVSLYDQYGAKLLHDLDGVTVTLRDGTSKTTDTNGYYQFDSVSTGTYNISISKPGYGATMVNNMAFVKDTVYKNIKLSAKPDFALATFTAYHNAGSPNDSLVASCIPDPRPRNYIVFVSNKPDAGPGNYLLTYTRPITAGITNLIALRIPYYDLNSAGIYYGEVVYYSAYAYVVNDASVYEDPATGMNVYTALGTALADSAIAP